jgi:hypothetical protein
MLEDMLGRTLPLDLFLTTGYGGAPFSQLPRL